MMMEAVRFSEMQVLTRAHGATSQNTAFIGLLWLAGMRFTCKRVLSSALRCLIGNKPVVVVGMSLTCRRFLCSALL
jgi:hypothetical protein